MGYYKNELIANQVEVGDRVPAPKPATEHVAYPYFETRRKRREVQDVIRLRTRQMNRELLVAALGYMTVGASIGFMIGFVL